MGYGLLSDDLIVVCDPISPHSVGGSSLSAGRSTGSSVGSKQGGGPTYGDHSTQFPALKGGNSLGAAQGPRSHTSYQTTPTSNPSFPGRNYQHSSGTSYQKATPTINAPPPASKSSLLETPYYQQHGVRSSTGSSSSGGSYTNADSANPPRSTNAGPPRTSGGMGGVGRDYNVSVSSSGSSSTPSFSGGSGLGGGGQRAGTNAMMASHLMPRNYAISKIPNSLMGCYT